MYNYLKKNSFLLIAIGAIPGAFFRWQIDQTITVNIIGCFLLGLINSLIISRKYKLIFGFGFCGSLTSFSGWIFHLFELFSQGMYKLFFLNSILIVIIGFFAVSLGHLLGKKINP